MNEQEQLNISLVNEWSLDFKDDWKNLNLMKFADGSVEIETGYSNECNTSFQISKEQKEYLIKWLQGND